MSSSRRPLAIELSANFQQNSFEEKKEEARAQPTFMNECLVLASEYLASHPKRSMSHGNQYFAEAILDICKDQLEKEIAKSNEQRDKILNVCMLTPNGKLRTQLLALLAKHFDINPSNFSQHALKAISPQLLVMAGNWYFINKPTDGWSARLFSHKATIAAAQSLQAYTDRPTERGESYDRWNFLLDTYSKLDGTYEFLATTIETILLRGFGLKGEFSKINPQSAASSVYNNKQIAEFQIRPILEKRFKQIPQQPQIDKHESALSFGL